MKRLKAHSRWVVIDSVSHLSPLMKGRVVVCGSHGGKAAANYLVKFRPRAVVFNDAGVGKQRAGIQALGILNRLKISGIAVSAASARIGEGWDTYRSGIVSFVNGQARRVGVVPGMTVKAVLKRLAA